MAGDPRPKPAKRKRGGRTLAPVGDRPCQACGYSGAGRERAHLLRGAHKEDHEHLIAVLCGPFGNPECMLHPRIDANELEAREILRLVLRPWQLRAMRDRRGAAWVDKQYPPVLVVDEDDEEVA